MFKHGSALSSIAVLCVALMASLFGTGKVASGQVLMRQLSKTITIVRTSEPSMARTHAAEHLADLTHKMARHKVDDKTLADLICLLDIPDDSVRFWVATSLGNLGTQAKAAIPKLEKTLSEVNCLNGAMTSATAIRQALTRMGVIPPPAPKCGRIAG